MSRKRGKRRKVLHANPLAYLGVLRNVAPVDESVVTRLDVKVRLAYERLKAGVGTTIDYDRVAWALNVAYERAKDIDEGLLEMVGAVGVSLESARERFEETGRFGFTGEQLLAMNAGMDAYVEIVRNSSPRQLRDADERVATWVNRLQAAKRQAA